MHALQERYGFVRRKVVGGKKTKPQQQQTGKEKVKTSHWGQNKKELQKWELRSDIRKIISTLRSKAPGTD